MTIRFIEGFETNAATGSSTDQYYERKFASTAQSPQSVVGRYAGLALQSSSYSFVTENYTAGDVWILHWHWFLNECGNTGQAAGVTISDGTGDQLELAIRSYVGDDNDDRYLLDLKRGATVLATAGPFWSEVWMSCQLKVTIDPTNGAYELKVAQAGSVGSSPVTVMSDVGPVNTANQAVADADRFEFSLNNGPRTMVLDHVVICDDAGAVNNDFLGEVFVAGLVPNLDGDDSDWNTSAGADHAALVNEIMPSATVTGVDDPERITSETIADYDRWFMQGLDAVKDIPTGTAIYGVSVETTASMEASGNRDLRPVFKDTTAAVSEGIVFNVTGTAWDTYVEIWETNPATAATWSVSTVDAGQFGVKVNA
tara:strand:+ start:14187 stop:15293 length:1107 start_codon:yes stop_codon:yes gene_type:complete